MTERQGLSGRVAREVVSARFNTTRRLTEALAEPLTSEDQTLQSMPDASPTKWHRAHTTWFFETFVLRPFDRDYRVFDAAYHYLFNSYYEAEGPRHPRPQRGMLSRPGASEIANYRAHVDAAMERFIGSAGSAVWDKATSLVELGLNHEEQHQELILMDIKHAFSLNPLEPAYATPCAARPSNTRPMDFIAVEGGLGELGHHGKGFAFDNEGPRHNAYVAPFSIASRLVTSGEYRAFIEDDGYRRPELWLSDGWATVQRENWQAPLYWRREEDGWSEFTLGGRRPIDEGAPVAHVSHYEADAFARWCGKRLPTEAEWEVAAVAHDVALAGNLMDSGHYHPQPAQEGGLAQMIGDVWEWTASPYTSYPGFRPVDGAVGEYNGKFMANQMVLRGGCAVTPTGHVRITYRNFFPSAARWAFGGMRLAEDA